MTTKDNAAALTVPLLSNELHLSIDEMIESDRKDDGENQANETANNEEPVHDVESNGALLTEQHRDVALHETSSLPQHEDEPPWWNCPKQVIAMVSNFSTSYNAVNVSLVIPILETLYTDATEEDVSACASSLLAGMMVGQVLGGALGDSCLGHLGALRVVMALQVIASIGSSLIFHENVFWALAVWRFVLGVGAGGVYPLAAVLSAEQVGSTSSNGSHTSMQQQQSVEETHEEKLQQMRRVVYTFSMQGVGFLAVPLLAVPLLYTLGNHWLGLVWRLLLGLGSVPGLVLMVLQWRLYRRTHDMEPLPLSEPSNDHPSSDLALGHDYDKDSPFMEHGHIDEAHEADEQQQVVVDDEVTSHHHVGCWDAIRSEPNLCQKLLGTAGTWFLFDMLFYGNTLFEPIVLEAAFGGGSNNTDGTNLETLQKAATDSLALATIALPGYIVSAVVMGRKTCNIVQTPRFVQLQGFVAMGLLYAVIGAYWPWLKRIPWLLVLLYGLTFFWANYGPNTTTFTLPSLMYAPDCRSTLNGISAACGKAGALVGATLFSPAAESLGDDRVMLLCGAVSILAFGLTHCCVRMPTTTSGGSA